MRGLFFLVAAMLAVSMVPGQDKSQPEDFRLATGRAAREYRTALPLTRDETLLKLYSKNLIMYTDKEVPPAYQFDFFNTLRNCLHSTATDPSIAAFESGHRPGQPNLEFPWKTPGGVHRCQNVTTIKFVHLPDAITYWYENMKKESHPQVAVGVRWEYPEGTVFGEILRLKDADDEPYTFELRTRTKSKGQWLANLYRPFTTRQEFVMACQAEGVTVGPAKLSVETLKNPHPQEVISRQAVVDVLPDLKEELVKKFLQRPFVSALGQAWISHDGLEGHAPTSKSLFHIVPKDYDGAFLAVNSKACMACHEGVLKHADDFELRRDWYGRVRGSDGIFSFHPFEPGCVGDSRNNLVITPRRSLVTAGLLKKWKAE